MDIVTHGMMGVAIAGPMLGTHPAEAAGFIVGSALPDLDALSRLFGKRAFLEWHQGWTHSLAVIALVGIVAYGVLHVLWGEAAGAAIGLGLGAALHVFLDLTNTYGVRAIAPFSRRRFCWEWLFFIDAATILLTVPAAGVAVLAVTNPNSADGRVAVAYGAGLAAYVALRAVLRWVARGRCGADVVSIIPSALWPWEYFVCSRTGEVVSVCRLNALSGRRTLVSEQPIYDAKLAGRLAAVPEFRIMSALSPAYHVVSYERSPDAVRVRCRDLRTVNFNTSFGTLDVVLSPDLEVRSANLTV